MSRFYHALFVATVVATLLARPTPAEAAIYVNADVMAQGEAFALDPMFDSVGWLAGRKDAGLFFAGSAVLIDPYWVLTAGHNLTRPDDSGLTEVRFSLSTSIFDDPPNFAHADAWFPFPGYSGTARPGTNHDIGLIRLAEPILDVTPAERFYGTDEPGMHANMAGFGTPGIWPNMDDWDGVKRAGENVADRLGWPLVAIEEQYWMSDFSRHTPLPLEWQGSPGDSGGGWFAEIDGRMQLIGINAFISGNSLATGATRVSLYNDWIDQTMALHSVPEPSSIILIGIGVLCIAGWRRFRRKPIAAG